MPICRDSQMVVVLLNSHSIWRVICIFADDVFRLFCVRSRESDGGSVVACTPSYHCRDRSIADCRGTSCLPSCSVGCPPPSATQGRGPTSGQQLPRRGRARDALLTEGAMEGHALARDLRRGEAARWRARSARARRKGLRAIV